MKRYYDKSLEDSYITVIDLETLGLNVREGSPILTVGLISFYGKDKPENLIRGNYFGIKQAEFNVLKIKPDPKTIEWWESKPELYRHTLEFANFDEVYSLGIIQTLGEISDYISYVNELAKEKETNHFIVGNSPSFDQGLLEFFYDKLGIECPWKYYQNLDLRTLMAIKGNTEEERTEHKARARKIVEQDFDYIAGLLDLSNLQHTAIYDAVLEAIQISDFIGKLK